MSICILVIKVNTQGHMASMCPQVLVRTRCTWAAEGGGVASGCADTVSAVGCVSTRLHHLRLHQPVAPLHRVLGTQWNQAADIWWTSEKRTIRANGRAMSNSLQETFADDN